MCRRGGVISQLSTVRNERLSPHPAAHYIRVDPPPPAEGEEKKMTAPDLPTERKASLDAKLQGVSRNEVAARAAQISKTYRDGGGSGAIASEADALAYALARMPATYAAVVASLNALVEITPDFAPTSLLDVGAGPGTASWAAAEAFSSLQSFAMLDANDALRALARVPNYGDSVLNCHRKIDLVRCPVIPIRKREAARLPAFADSQPTRRQRVLSACSGREVTRRPEIFSASSEAFCLCHVFLRSTSSTFALLVVPLSCVSFLGLPPADGAAGQCPISHQLHPQLPSDRMCGAGEGPERDGLVVGVEQPVELGAAGFHAPGKTGL